MPTVTRKVFDGMKCSLLSPAASLSIISAPPRSTHTHTPVPPPPADPLCDVRESATWGWSVYLLSVSGNLAWLNADKRLRENALLFLLVRKELTRVCVCLHVWVWGVGVQILGSMVTECVINAIVCPVPRTYQPQDPFSDSSKEGEVSRRGGSIRTPRTPPTPPFMPPHLSREGI